MPGGWWCCCDCITGSDYFNRANASTLGSGWTESGTLGIDTNRCYMTAGAYAWFETPLPDPLGSFIAEFDTASPQDNDVYEVIVSFDGGTSIDLKARFEVDSGNSEWIISLHDDSSELIADDDEVLAGCDTYQEPFLAGRTFNVSYDRSIFRVGGTTPEYPHYELWYCVTHPEDADIRIGLQHGGGPRTIYMDNFEISDHFVHNPRCPGYGCVCGLEG